MPFRRFLLSITLVVAVAGPAFAQAQVQPPAPVATEIPSAAPTADTPKGVAIPSGELIAVAVQQDIGSRISSEGDTFAVLTVQDYYVRGGYVLPKGSPGYGLITHVKRAGSFHAGGELTFTVKRLIAPDGTEINVETNGATSDADKQTEKNGNEFGQYLLWGVGMFAKRGNDMLVKRGTTFHVSTLQVRDVPVVPYGTAPAPLNEALIKHQ